MAATSGEEVADLSSNEGKRYYVEEDIMRTFTLSLLFAALVASQAAGAEWLPGGSDAHEQILYAPRSIRIVNHNVKVWLDHKSKDEETNYLVAGYHEFVEIDCRKNDYRTLNRSMYGHSGKEFNMDPSPAEKGWKNIPTGIMTETARTICTATSRKK